MWTNLAGFVWSVGGGVFSVGSVGPGETEREFGPDLYRVKVHIRPFGLVVTDICAVDPQLVQAIVKLALGDAQFAGKFKWCSGIFPLDQPVNYPIPLWGLL